MLYELIAVVRPGNLSEIKEIARTTGQQVLRSRGVIRGITNWGPFLLPKPTTKHQSQHHQGHYFIMRFDSSAETQHSIRRSLGLDPRMIRFSVVKIGDKLRGKQGAMESITGQVDWMSPKEDLDMMNFASRHGQRGAMPDLF